LNRKVDVVYDVLTANYDCIMSAGGVARAADDGGAEAALKRNIAASGVASPTGDGRRVIEGGVAFATTDAGVGTAGGVASPAANAGAEAEMAGGERSDVALAAADAGIG
jgi:hypothetical protein